MPDLIQAGRMFGFALVIAGASSGAVSAQSIMQQPWGVLHEPEPTRAIDWLQYANSACGPAKDRLPGITVKWFGDCRDGWLEGAGTLKVSLSFPNHITFVGSFDHGRAEGSAHVTFDTGPVKSFDGIFHDDQPNGNGTLVDNTGLRFEGDFVYDRATDGKVTVDYRDGARLTYLLGGVAPNNQFAFRYADGTKFEILGTKSQSRHVTAFADGGRLVREFVDGYDNDGAVYCSPAGRRYAGKFIPVTPDPAQPTVSAVYPMLARRLNEQGIVEISMIIAADGSTSHIAIHDSPGFERLENAALAAAAHWRYLPAKVAGHPIAMPVIVEVPFHRDPNERFPDNSSDAPVSIAVSLPVRRNLGGLDDCAAGR